MTRWLAAQLGEFYRHTGGSAPISGCMWLVCNVLLLTALIAASKVRPAWMLVSAILAPACAGAAVVFGALTVTTLVFSTSNIGSLIAALALQSALTVAMVSLVLRSPSLAWSGRSLLQSPFVASLVLKPLVITCLLLLAVTIPSPAPWAFVSAACLAGSLIADEVMTALVLGAYRRHGDGDQSLTRLDCGLAGAEMIVVSDHALRQPAIMIGAVLPRAGVVVQRWVADAARDATAPGHEVASAILIHEGAHLRGRHAQWRGAAFATVFMIGAWATSKLGMWIAPIAVGACPLLSMYVATVRCERLADNRVRELLGATALQAMRAEVRRRLPAVRRDELSPSAVVARYPVESDGPRGASTTRTDSRRVHDTLGDNGPTV